MLPSDTQRFTSLTEQAYSAYQKNPAGPSGEIAVEVAGKTVMAPQITAPISSGAFDISAGSGQTSSLQQLYDLLTGR